MATAGTEQAGMAVAGMSSGQGNLFLSNVIINIFSISEKLKHMVCHLEMSVGGGEGVWVCFFPIEVFLRAGGSHPTRTRLKAKELFRKVLNKESG